MGEYADMAIEEGMRQFDDGMPPFEPGYRVKYRAKPEGPGPCPRCGAPTNKRVGAHGVFFGCSTFPTCKGSRNWVEPKTPVCAAIKPIAPVAGQMPVTNDDLLIIIERMAKFRLADGRTVLERLNPELKALVEQHLPE